MNKSLVKEIADYWTNHPNMDVNQIYLHFKKARAKDVRAARRLVDKGDCQDMKVWCEFGAHDCITFDETRLTDDFDEMRLEFLEAIEEHMHSQEISFYEIDDTLVDYNEVQVTVCDDEGEIIANGWIKEI